MDAEENDCILGINVKFIDLSVYFKINRPGSYFIDFTYI